MHVSCRSMAHLCFTNVWVFLLLQYCRALKVRLVPFGVETSEIQTQTFLLSLLDDDITRSQQAERKSLSLDFQSLRSKGYQPYL